MLGSTSLRFTSFRLSDKWYGRLTLANAFAVWFLIVLGGSVRVTGSATGCGDSWPSCNGRLLPAMEYHELVEWNHRLFSLIVAVLMVVTVGSTLLWFRSPRRLPVLALAAAFFYLLQAAVGAISVLLRLDQAWTAIHMGNSMLLIGSVTLLALYVRVGPLGIGESNRWLRWFSLGALVWTYLALFSGSAVIGTDSAVACPDWPQCSNTQILPASTLEWVNFGHRLAVGMSDILLITLGVLVWRYRRQDRRLLFQMRILVGLFIIQVFLGAFTIWLNAPEFLKGAHLAVAAATWSALVVLTVFVWAGAPRVVEPGNPGNGGGIRREPSREQQWRSGITQNFNAKSNLVGETLSTGDTKFTNRRTQPPPTSPNRVVLKLRVMAQHYFGLMRPRVIPLLLVPAFAAILMAAVKHPTQRSILELTLLVMAGGTLATGGAHAINQYFDRDIDALMKRTRRRPVVAGLIAPHKALIFGVFLTVSGTGLLWITVNPVAALLALGGNLFYLVVYTIWLKRTSVQNIVIGGAAGAVPPLVGWAAVTGSLDLPALLLFAIIFFWTPAHFWALALVRQEEYREAGVPMLPVVRGEKVTRTSILVYVLLLFGTSPLPFVLNALSWLYLLPAAGLGLLLVRQSLKLISTGSKVNAWRFFKLSNTYLAALYLSMVLDRLLSLRV